MDIKNVFDVKTVDMTELFANAQEKCFYIPAYQRPYSWKKDDINRMWEDIVYGLEQLNSSDDYVTFLGSIITMHDIKHQSIAPIVRGEVPSKVMVIIDGQQRLTTLLLLVISLDNLIRKKLTVDNEKSLSRVLDTLAFVDKMYKSPKSYGLNKSKDYPKIIRAYDDQWATNEKQEQYNSPIARLLKQYIYFVKDDKNKRKLFSYSTEGIYKDKESHEEIKSNINIFKKSIADFLKDKTKIHQIMIDKSELLDVERSIFQGSDGESGIRKEIADNADKKEIFILLLVLRFVLLRVFVADIAAKKEEYAFEMFDSLNTTGDPLTAFETFKPKVVESVGLEKYFDSNSYKSMNEVEDYLKKDPKNRDKITNQLITAFALAESGKTLSKKLREQRIYLRDEYKASSNKEAFVKNLSIVSQFYNIWNMANKDPNEIIIKYLKDDKVALTCLQFLAKKHTITIALLSRFYDKSLLNNSGDDFAGAIKAVAAFFTLWRSARTGTAGIDNCYRDLMSKGVENPRFRGDDGMEILQNKIPAFNRQKNTDSIDLDSLKTALRYFLFKGATDGIEIYSKQTWLNKVKNIDIYIQNKEVCKLMLISAFDDAVAHLDGLGLIEKGRNGVSKTLEKEFNNVLFESIEHISPKSSNWNNVTDERKHTLGNLTLLPALNNASAGNRRLPEKELMFKALSAKTQNEQEKYLKESKIKFKDNTKAILAQSQHFPYLESLSNLQGWSDEIIKQRTENLSSIIWDKLAIEWLGFKE